MLVAMPASAAGLLAASHAFVYVAPYSDLTDTEVQPHSVCEFARAGASRPLFGSFFIILFSFLSPHGPSPPTPCRVTLSVVCRYCSRPCPCAMVPQWCAKCAHEDEPLRLRIGALAIHADFLILLVDDCEHPKARRLEVGEVGGARDPRNLQACMILMSSSAAATTPETPRARAPGVAKIDDGRAMAGGSNALPAAAWFQTTQHAQ